MILNYQTLFCSALCKKKLCSALCKKRTLFCSNRFRFQTYFTNSRTRGSSIQTDLNEKVLITTLIDSRILYRKGQTEFARENPRESDSTFLVIKFTREIHSRNEQIRHPTQLLGRKRTKVRGRIFPYRGFRYTLLKFSSGDLIMAVPESMESPNDNDSYPSSSYRCSSLLCQGRIHSTKEEVFLYLWHSMKELQKKHSMMALQKDLGNPVVCPAVCPVVSCPIHSVSYERFQFHVKLSRC